MSSLKRNTCVIGIRHETGNGKVDTGDCDGWRRDDDKKYQFHKNLIIHLGRRAKCVPRWLCRLRQVEPIGTGNSTHPVIILHQQAAGSACRSLSFITIMCIIVLCATVAPPRLASSLQSTSTLLLMMMMIECRSPYLAGWAFSATHRRVGVCHFCVYSNKSEKEIKVGSEEETCTY